MSELSHHQRGYHLTRLKISALSSEEVTFLLDGIDLLQAVSFQLAPTDAGMQTVRNLHAVKERLARSQATCLFTVKEWSLLRTAAEVRLDSGSFDAARGAVHKVQGAAVVVQGDTPSLQALMTAANSLNTDIHLPQTDTLRLNFTIGDWNGSGGQGYEPDHEGHRELLTAAARYLSEGEQASVRLSWSSEDRRARIRLLTVESLSCDCGQGVWCPLTILITQPPHAQRRQYLTRAGAR